MGQAIRDIRWYCSEFENIDGNPNPHDFYIENFTVGATIDRIVLKLREKGFSMGDFHHLYLNFTTCPVEGKMAPSKRSVNRYYPWYRYYDIEVSKVFFDSPATPDRVDTVLKLLEELMIKFFAGPGQSSEMIHACFEEAITQGENMKMLFKSKSTTTRKALVYLRLLDTGEYSPLLEVYDTEDNLLFETDLPKMRDFDAMGEIQVSKKAVTIKPRKNFFTEGMSPMTYNY